MDFSTDQRHQYVDTHTHFLDDHPETVAPIVNRALAAGVMRMLAPATDFANCRVVLAVAAAHEAIYAGIGIHPNEAAEDDDFVALARLADHPRVRAVGETGLDYYRDHTLPSLQRSHLEQHMRLAAEKRLPIVLHNREADDDLYAIARSFGEAVVGIMHCFSSSMAVAERFLGLGYYISFAGNVTFPANGSLRAIAAAVPSDRLLAETDSPYLAPVPFRGKKNEPAYVVHTMKVLADSRRQPVADLATDVGNNAQRLFGW